MMSQYNGSPEQVEVLKSHLRGVYPGEKYGSLSGEKISLAASDLLDLSQDMKQRAGQAAKLLPREDALGMLYGLILAADASQYLRERADFARDHATPEQRVWVREHMGGLGLESKVK